MSTGWTHADSPFHPGEQAAQARAGVRDKVETFARRVMRDHMPEQHRAFYAGLPFVLLGTVDGQGRPWASLVPGRPGFMTAADSRTLVVAARPLPGDPLNETLQAGAEVGLLGIQLETRRRNRLTGRVARVREDGFEITLRQAFGNCPQYIQTRAVEVLPESDWPQDPPIRRSDRFDAATHRLIESADTLFIASAYGSDPAAPAQGADVSHRGGKPGFVRVEDDRTFVFPDFSGNNHFNTVGNLLLNPGAGVLFVDFERGDLVTLSGKAEIVWEGEALRAFQGAERLIRIRAEAVIRIAGVLPLRFAFDDYSPMLSYTGTWRQADETLAAARGRNAHVPFEIFEIRPESETISSFYLRRVDGKAPARHEPGQFLPIRLSIPGVDGPVARTYTISDAPNGDHYRLSIKRESGNALVSTYLHDHASRGLRLEAMAPRGRFHLDTESQRPVVLISAGVGVTPMIAMTNFIIEEGLRTRNFRRTYFIHGARNGREHAFGRHIRELAARHDNLTAHIRYSRPEPDDRLGETHDSAGHVDIDLVKSLLPLDDYEFYICGPARFMQDLSDGLLGLGVRPDRIHTESFGPATVRPSSAGAAAQGAPVPVRFARSGIEATWTPTQGTLLELAEANGLAPDFACRSGICGTCATRMACGGVDYLEEPSAPHGDDEVLICRATPRATAGPAGCGAEHGVVLEL